ncbi:MULTISPECIES: acetyl-CoA carboxylase biotin carboxyl carrier protein subunit [Streptococcus]|uniref:Acetyl-CoA carboxylase biotin carboxyl carrier protein subunit n=1 Tax=Streptococcus dysgalactiae subsp. equisimilis AC-2713 TaxID=759913 RepID=A0AB33R5G6_STREQ|nr:MULTISPECIES: acetyl-CoA carboxylase biotin carboxyl carrier protein subunit [Streptococcus]KKC22024.1 acetyl-CoA carboxylase [Streptococcus dysgalactiae subsp. equisimilis]OBZ05660.1 acetyl-CoA carboxylase biotin carboxyl carrier protein subunit [Streptococcus dysgalactiae subsp. equisimilis]OCX04696.1 acetyl-CoA carboxylase biotin carboxyl carrier protein subunit [Streptococcus dysgalactiae subsp. equisimilis AKSDE4288]QJD61875.1 acetyl-CoA carboxylase biotin carboxyl carrier protein subun
MLRKFKITIDGKEYLVEMEEIGAPVQASTPVQPTPAPVSAPAEASPQVEEAQAPQPTAAAGAGADAIPSPMPGTILKVLVAVGDQVAENQPLLILEAMKMENEIVASSAGTVSAIHVSPGQVVNPGDGLITIG